MIPQNLSHKPIVAVDNYDLIDGYNNGSDAKALSIGKAQYDENDISAKVFRRNDKKGIWSRQSEALPLHRCVDMCNLIVQSILIAKGIKYDYSSYEVKPQIVDKNGFILLEDLFASDDFSNRLKDKPHDLYSLLSILKP